MATYQFQLPDGTFFDVPSGMPVSAAEAWARKTYPDAYPAAPEAKQSSNIFADVAGSVIKGVGNIAQMPGQIATLTGLADQDNVATRFGSSISDFGQNLKSDSLKTQEAKMDVARKKAEELGLGEEVKTALYQYASNPYVTFNALIEQLPQLLMSFGAGTAAQMGTKALIAGASKGAVKTAGVVGASGTAALQQGADVGDETYKRVYEAAKAQNYGDDDAKAVALAESRKAAALAGGVSAATMGLLPGVEKTLMRGIGTKGLAKGAAKGFAGEAAQETLEEGSGALFANQGVQAVDADAPTWKGVGSRATTGGILGGLMGGVAGGYHGRQAGVQEERDAQTKLASERAATQAETDAAAQKSFAEETARKQTPEYLRELRDDVAARKAQLEDINGQIKAFGKVTKGTPEALAKKELEDQRKELGTEARPRFAEFNSRKDEISALPTNEAVYDAVMDAPVQPTAKEMAAASRARLAEAETARIGTGLRGILDGVDYAAKAEGRKDGDVDSNEYLDMLAREPELLRKAQAAQTQIPGMTSEMSNLYINGALELSGKIDNEYSQGANARVAADTAAQTSEAQNRRGEQDLDAILEALGQQPTTKPTAAYVQPAKVPTATDQIAQLELQVQQHDAAIKQAANPDFKLFENGQVTEAGRQAVLAQSLRDASAKQLEALKTEHAAREQRGAVPSPAIDTLPAKVDSLFGASATAEDVHARVENLHTQLAGRIGAYSDAIADTAEVRDDAHFAAKNPEMHAKLVADNTRQVDRQKSEIALVAVDQIKAAREANGLKPLPMSDTALYGHVLGKLTVAFNEDAAAPAKTADGQTQNLKSTPSIVVARRNTPTLDANGAEAQTASPLEIERRRALNRQLREVNDRLRTIANNGIDAASLSADVLRSTGATSGIGRQRFTSAEVEQHVATLKAARDNLMKQIDTPFGQHVVARQVQRIVDNLSIGKASQRENLVSRMQDVEKRLTDAQTPKSTQDLLALHRRMESLQKSKHDADLLGGTLIDTLVPTVTDIDMVRRTRYLPHSLQKQRAPLAPASTDIDAVRRARYLSRSLQKQIASLALAIDAHPASAQSKKLIQDLRSQAQQLRNKINTLPQTGDDRILGMVPAKGNTRVPQASAPVLQGTQPEANPRRAEFSRVFRAAMAQGMTTKQAKTVANGQADALVARLDGRETTPTLDTRTGDLIEHGHAQDMAKHDAAFDALKDSPDATAKSAALDEALASHAAEDNRDKLVSRVPTLAERVRSLKASIAAQRADAAKTRADEATARTEASAERSNQQQRLLTLGKEKDVTSEAAVDKVLRDAASLGLKKGTEAHSAYMAQRGIDSAFAGAPFTATESQPRTSNKAKYPYYAEEKKKVQTEPAREAAAKTRNKRKHDRLMDSLDTSENSDVSAILADNRAAFDKAVAMGRTSTNIAPHKSNGSTKTRERMFVPGMTEVDRVAYAKKFFSGLGSETRGELMEALNAKGPTKGFFLALADKLASYEAAQTSGKVVGNAPTKIETSELKKAGTDTADRNAAQDAARSRDEEDRKKAADNMKLARDRVTADKTARMNAEAEKMPEGRAKAKFVKSIPQEAEKFTGKVLARMYPQTLQKPLSKRLGGGEMSEGDPDTLYSMNDTVPEKPIDSKSARAVVDAFMAKAPQELRDKIKYYASPSAMPVALLTQMQRENDGISESMVRGALMSNGDIVIVGDAHTDVNDLKATIAHEVFGHYGLEKLLGNEGVRMLTERMMRGNGIAETAKALGVQDAIAQAAQDSIAAHENEDQTNRRAVREILAHLSEKVPSETVLEKISRFMQELRGAIRFVFDKLGVGNTEKLTNGDIHFLLARARKAALQEGASTDAPTAEATLYRNKTAKYADEFADLATTAPNMVSKNKTIIERIRDNATNIFSRTRFIDNHSDTMAAARKGDKTAAIQLQAELMNYNNRNHFVHQAVMVGPVTRSLWDTQMNGKDVYQTEAVEGASLKRFATLLGKVKGIGDDKATYEAFDMYAQSKRAETLGWDRVNGSLSAEDRATADRNKPKLGALFADAYAEYQAVHRGSFKFLLDAGVVSEKEYRVQTSKQNYTPLFREKGGDLIFSLDSGRDITFGKIKDEPQLKKLLGDDTKPLDFFTASVQNIAFLTELGLRNIASTQAAFTLEALGGAHPVGATEKSENVIEFRKDGGLQRMLVDTDTFGIPTELVVKGLAGVPASLPGFVRMLGLPATFLRKAVTRNPLYLARQIQRDAPAAYMTTGANMNPITDVAREVGRAIAGTMDKTLERRGITGGMTFGEDFTDIENIRKTAMSNPSALSWLFAKADQATHDVDTAVRNTVYDGALKEGAHPMVATLAAYDAMPFSKRGTSPSVRYLGHMIPFLSSTIQGWDVLYRAATGNMPLADKVNIRMKLAKRGALIAGMSFLYGAAMQDDDEYKNANTTTRLNNWFVRFPGMETSVRIPIPFELGVPFKMLPEALARMVFADKEVGKELKDVAGALLGMVPNPLMAQAIKPAYEAYMNKSMYTGHDIEGRALQGIDIGKRSDEKTSELSKRLGFDAHMFGTQIGISPKKLEYMLSQYTAGLYPAAAMLIDKLLPAPTVSKPDRTLADLPLFRTVLQKADEGGEVNRLYDQIDNLARYAHTYKKLAVTDGEEARQYLEENRVNIGLGMAADKVKAALDKISKIEHTIIGNPNMDGTAKQEALARVRAAKTAMARQYASALN